MVSSFVPLRARSGIGRGVLGSEGLEKLGVVNAFGGGLKSLSLGNTDQSVGIIMCGVVRAREERRRRLFGAEKKKKVCSPLDVADVDEVGLKGGEGSGSGEGGESHFQR